MATIPHVESRKLLLTRIDFGGVEFDLVENGQRVRPVRVSVESGPSWRKSVRFPEVHGASTASTGDKELDRAIRERAAEELVRLEAATTVLGAAA
jgi:hypothetical protein